MLLLVALPGGFGGSDPGEKVDDALGVTTQGEADADAESGGGGTSPLIHAAPAVLLHAGRFAARRVARRRERLDSD